MNSSVQAATPNRGTRLWEWAGAGLRGPNVNDPLPPSTFHQRASVDQRADQTALVLDYFRHTRVSLRRLGDLHHMAPQRWRAQTMTDQEALNSLVLQRPDPVSEFRNPNSELQQPYAFQINCFLFFAHLFPYVLIVALAVSRS